MPSPQRRGKQHSPASKRPPPQATHADSLLEQIGAFIDLEMLLNTYGRERTEQQYRTLLEQSGFTLRRIVPTASGHSIIEGVAI
jgi:hypothetical protein